MKVASERLTSRAFPLHGRPDLLDFYDPLKGFYLEHGDDGVVGVGAAARIDVEPGPDLVARAAASARATLDVIDGDRALVCGALPFDGVAVRGELVVPKIAIVRRNGVTSMIVTGREGMPDPETIPHDPPPEPWDTLRVTSEEDPAAYVGAVSEARARIHAGLLRKVVLARTVIAESDHLFDVPALLARLRMVEPDAYVFGVHGFLGASPELLVARAGDVVRSHPLAGTTPRSPQPATDEAAGRRLLGSQKDLLEHAFVAQAVGDALAPLCISLDVGQPRLLATSKVWHLATDVRGTLRAPAPSALEIAALLHPTPAVCGTPRDRAMEVIRELEPRARGLYAGSVGWVDGECDGVWAVALRCAEIDGKRARLYAGAGIVEGSDPRAELDETDAKMRALLDALRYG